MIIFYQYKKILIEKKFKIDEKLYKNILIYCIIGCVTIKDSKYLKN